MNFTFNLFNIINARDDVFELEVFSIQDRALFHITVFRGRVEVLQLFFFELRNLI